MTRQVLGTHAQIPMGNYSIDNQLHNGLIEEILHTRHPVILVHNSEQATCGDLVEDMQGQTLSF